MLWQRKFRRSGGTLLACWTLSVPLFVASLMSAFDAVVLADDIPVTDGKTANRARTDREIWSQKISLNMQNAPLREVLQQIAKTAGVPLQLDAEALKESDIDLNRINHVMLTNVELNYALVSLMWRQRPFFAAPLTEVRDGVLFITTDLSQQARIKQALPAWLQEIYDNHKIRAELNRDRQIISLHVYRPLTDELLAQISTLTKLRDFEIHGDAQFTATGATAFAKMVSLERLKVSSSQAPADLPNLWDLVLGKLSELETLCSLELSETGISDQGIAAVCRRGQLTSLRLYQEGRLTDVAMESIASQSHLKQLDLTSYVGTQFGRMHFSQEATRLLQNLEELETLSLPGHDFTSDMFEFPKLKSLLISGSRFQAADAANIARCSELASLDLSYSHIDDNAFKWLADHPKLSRLVIRSRGITDDAFAPLKRISKLKHIHLWTSGLTDRSLEHFTAMTSLAHLSFNWGTNSFKREGITGLADSVSLKSLELRIIPQSGGLSGGLIGISAKEPDFASPVTLVLPENGARPQLPAYDRDRLPFDINPVVAALPMVHVTVTHDEFFGGK